MCSSEGCCLVKKNPLIYQYRIADEPAGKAQQGYQPNVYLLDFACRSQTSHPVPKILLGQQLESFSEVKWKPSGMPAANEPKICHSLLSLYDPILGRISFSMPKFCESFPIQP